MSGVVSATTVALVSVGIGETVAAIAAPILLGAATGAIGSAITGGNPLTGALTGAIGGGFGELGGFVGSALDIGSTAGGALAGAAGGALGAGITGGNPLMGAAGGALSGGISGYMSSDTPAAGVSGPSTPDASGGVSPTGENTGVGPTVANAAAGSIDPNSLSSLAAASTGNSNPLLNPPNAGSSINFGGTGSSGLSSADQAFLNGTAAPAASGGIGPTVGSAPASTSSWNSLSDNPISNALFGSGSSSTPATTQTAQQAMDKMNSTGQAQMFTQGGQTYMLNTDGTPTAIGKTGDSGALGGLAGKGLSGLLSNPLQSALLGTQLYNMSQAPALPTLQQQQAATQGPTFSMDLPQYKATQSRNPIADYYTYGYSPQPTQISTTLTPTTGQGTGNAPIKLAVGGLPRPKLPGAPHLPHAPRRNAGAGAAMLGALSHMRRAGSVAPTPPMGGALSGGMPTMAHGGLFAHQGQVQTGTGTKGQADKVPAMLSEDEFVIPADVVSNLGDGSSNAGGGVLKQFVENVRTHKAQRGRDGMPPKAKSPEQYMRRA